MKLILITPLLISFLVLGFTTQAQEKAFKNCIKKAPISKGDAFYPLEYQFESGGKTIKLDFQGHLTADGITKIFPLTKIEFVEAVRYFEFNDKLILFVQLTDLDRGSTFIYGLDKKTLSIEWKIYITNYDLYVGQLEEEILYLGGGETVYAIDCEIGKINWQTKKDFEKHGLTTFEYFKVTDKEVQMTAECYSRDDVKSIKSFVLKKKDGTIVSIN